VDLVTKIVRRSKPDLRFLESLADGQSSGVSLFAGRALFEMFLNGLGLG
jgi:hypothetical protein